MTEAVLMGISAILKQLSLSGDLPSPSRWHGLCPEGNGEPQKDSQQGMDVRSEQICAGKGGGLHALCVCVGVGGR